MPRHKQEEIETSFETEPEGVPIVRVVRARDGNSLVQIIDDKGDHHMAWFPTEKITEDGKRLLDELDHGLAHGDPFHEALKDLPKPAELIRLLHNAGLWTWEDLQSNPAVVLSAIATAYGKVVSGLISGHTGG